jgi:hypothetical protein
MAGSTVRALAATAILVFLLSGCQSPGTDGLGISEAPAAITGAAASAIAGDMVSRLAEQVGQGKATVVLKQDGSPFGQALEAALRSWGYAVITDQKTDKGAHVIPLAYLIVPYEGQVLARLSTDTVELGRAYRLSAGGAQPSSALSLMKRN